MTALRPTTTDALLEYPDSDGNPMAESEFQSDPLITAVQVLKTYFQHHPDVYVVGNLLVYYAQDPPHSIAPDVFVVRGVSTHKRTSYRLWEEGKGLDWVLEITSHSTRAADQGDKRDTYERLGVQEYWQYDPTGDYLTPPLQGLELIGGVYHPMAIVETPGDALRGTSAVLGLELRLVQGELRFHDPRTGQTLRTHRESEARVVEETAARQQAEARVAEETAARQQAEARVAEETAARQKEAQARQQAETRIAELEARLRDLEGPSEAP